MHGSLDSQILQWIGEECGEDVSSLGAVVSLHLLFLRLALSRQEANQGMTHSVELSVSAFDRSQLVRVLKNHERKGFLQFVNGEGARLTEIELREFQASVENDCAKGYVQLTEDGKRELERLKGMAQNSNQSFSKNNE